MVPPAPALAQDAEASTEGGGGESVSMAPAGQPPGGSSTSGGSGFPCWLQRRVLPPAKLPPGLLLLMKQQGLEGDEEDPEHSCR
jgi:hypothetical protein